MPELSKEQLAKYLSDMQTLTGTNNRFAIQQQKDEQARTPHQASLEEQRVAISAFNKLSDRAFEYIKSMGFLDKTEPVRR